MGRADSLSRWPDQQMKIEKDNEDKVLLKKEQLAVRATETVEGVIEGVDILEKIRESKAKNDEVIKAMEEMK